MKKYLVISLIGLISGCGQTLPQKPSTEVLQQNGGQQTQQSPQDSTSGQNASDGDSQVRMEKFTFALMTYQGCEGCDELKGLLKNNGVLTSSEPPVTLSGRYSSSIAVEHCHLLSSKKPNCLDDFKKKIGFDPGLQVPFFVLYPDQSKKLVFDSRALNDSSMQEIAELIKKTFDEIAKHSVSSPTSSSGLQTQSGTINPFQQASVPVSQPAGNQQQTQPVPVDTSSQQNSSSGSSFLEKIGESLTILGQIFKK